MYISGMRLSDYLATTGQTVTAFGAQIGRSAASVSRIANDKQRPDWDTIEAIERETQGRVSRNDFGPAPVEPGEAA